MSAPNRDLDRVLEGLLQHCGPDPYRLVPGGRDRWSKTESAPAHWDVSGEGWPTLDARLIPGEPDHYVGRCPMHPDAGYTLVIREKYPGAKASIWCRVGCPEAAIRYALIEDPEREQRAQAVSAGLLWKQKFARKRRAA